MDDDVDLLAARADVWRCNGCSWTSMAPKIATSKCRVPAGRSESEPGVSQPSSTLVPRDLRPVIESQSGSWMVVSLPHRDDGAPEQSFMVSDLWVSRRAQ